MSDPYDLQRFVQAQDRVLEQVRAELREGRKTSHWMWFVFPQIAGLGSSAMSRRYAIASREEAAAYVQHPVLGPRLRECTELMNRVDGRSAAEILGGIDAQKFQSSMTLFAQATADNAVFQHALQKFFGGRQDDATLGRL